MHEVTDFEFCFSRVREFENKGEMLLGSKSTESMYVYMINKNNLLVYIYIYIYIYTHTYIYI